MKIAIIGAGNMGGALARGLAQGSIIATSDIYVSNPSTAKLDALKNEYPEINVNIQTGTVSELYGGMLDGRFDFCFGSTQSKYDFKYVPLFEDYFYAVLPKDYPVREDGTFPVSHFNGTKFLMPGLGFDEEISAVFSKNNVKPFVTQTYVDDPAIISMVEHNIGVSMLSELILINRHNDVNLVPIVPASCRQLGIALPHDKVLSPMQKRFIAITKEYVKGFAHPHIY
jgi:DNA-binding transcriptional LysR family regulator